MGTRAFISASGSESPCPCEPQTKLWALKRAYSYCDTAEGMKQTVHLYYWFLHGNYYILDDFNGTFSACCVILCRENVLKFKKNIDLKEIYCAQAWGSFRGSNFESVYVRRYRLY